MGRRIEQSLKAPSANGSSDTTTSPRQFTRHAKPTSGSICRFSGVWLSGNTVSSCESGNCPRNPSAPGTYHGKIPLGADVPAGASVTTFTKSADSPACSRWPAKFPATPKPNQVRSSFSSTSNISVI
ncbi:Uncharacterised protein [Mycobacteroides abscessus subsp. abscessus]|nr:Uncharacterised protein [Mycobacteroides abscessus subsp. abscessus]